MMSHTIRACNPILHHQTVVLHALEAFLSLSSLLQLTHLSQSEVCQSVAQTIACC